MFASEDRFMTMQAALLEESQLQTQLLRQILATLQLQNDVANIQG